jgi:hypothetical protein
MLARFLPFLFLFNLISGNALAEEESSTSLTGRVYTNQYFPVYSSPTYTSGLFQSSLSAWLDFQATPFPDTSLHVIGQGDVFFRSLSEPNQTSFNFKIREGFFGYQSESTELRVGQQIIPWGKSDGINPTDYFTAKDYTQLNPDDEVRRIGAPSILFSFTPQKGTSPINITGVFQAVYPQSKLLIPDSAIPTGVQFQKYPLAPTMFQQNTVEFGGKISYLQNQYDLSISAFRGMNHFAQYVYDIPTNQINPMHIQQTVVGGDLSFTTGDYVIRAETAYFIPDNGPENTELYGLLQPAHWDSVAGIERTFFDDIRTQVQFLYRYHIAYLHPSLYATANPILTQIQQSVARSNALLLNFQRQDNLGATFRIGYSSEESSWTADLFLVGYFSQGNDYLLRPQISFQGIENLRLLIGGDFYGGDETRPLGALKNNSALFFEARYLF